MREKSASMRVGFSMLSLARCGLIVGLLAGCVSEDVSDAPTNCVYMWDCDDQTPCTVDRCVAGACDHVAEPSYCPAGSTCVTGRGCLRDVRCMSSEDCRDDDPCTVSEQCADGRCLVSPSDQDRDGHGALSCGGDDCDDGNARIYPGVAERCNGGDDDCDGIVDNQNPSRDALCGPFSACVQGRCVCESGRTECFLRCIDTTSDDYHCGSCSVHCTSGATCVGGRCTCNTGLTECSGVCVDLRTNRRDCGACSAECFGPYNSCQEGHCGCVPGAVMCEGECADLMQDSRHCGTCGVDCGGLECVNGHCGCRSGTVNCSGHCVNLDSSPNCGACGVDCGGLDCAGRHCGCIFGVNCNGHCVNLDSNPNCGACGRSCEYCGPFGVCRCARVLDVRCPGGCVDISFDNNNCGSCGRACEMGTICRSRECVRL